MENSNNFLDPVCPICRPDADPLLCDVRVCYTHTDYTPNPDDAQIGAQLTLGTGNSEIDSETNRAACDFFHRGIVRTEPIPASPAWKNWDSVIS